MEYSVITLHLDFMAVRFQAIKRMTLAEGFTPGQSQVRNSTIVHFMITRLSLEEGVTLEMNQFL